MKADKKSNENRTKNSAHRLKVLKTKPLLTKMQQSYQLNLKEKRLSLKNERKIA